MQVLKKSLFKGKFSKGNSAAHFKKFHTDRPLESCIQCPRCPEQMAKSSLNSHMEQKHQLKNFNQLLKRSYLPDAHGSVQEPTHASENSVAKRKMPKSIMFGEQLINGPLFEPVDFGNNNANIQVKEEFNIKQE